MGKVWDSNRQDERNGVKSISCAIVIRLSRNLRKGGPRSQPQGSGQEIRRAGSGLVRCGWSMGKQESATAVVEMRTTLPGGMFLRFVLFWSCSKNELTDIERRTCRVSPAAWSWVKLESGGSSDRTGGDELHQQTKGLASAYLHSMKDRATLAKGECVNKQTLGL